MLGTSYKLALVRRHELQARASGGEKWKVKSEKWKVKSEKWKVNSE